VVFGSRRLHGVIVAALFEFLIPFAPFAPSTPRPADSALSVLPEEPAEMTASLTFDPVAVGRAETDSWAAYYRHEWPKLLVAALVLVREGFRLNRRETIEGAWYVLRANQAWAPFPDNDPAAARTEMAKFYAVVNRAGRLRVDPVRAAELEVEWWRVHRAHQHDPAVGAESLVQSLVDLYAYVYGADPAAVRRAAELRVEAMDHSDAWVSNGCSLADPLLAKERLALVASYAALRDALDRGSLPGAR
jgi:hypothetical protein